jgi:hypothetical protein
MQEMPMYGEQDNIAALLRALMWSLQQHEQGTDKKCQQQRWEWFIKIASKSSKPPTLDA